jgi:hypothetical protein
MHEYSEILFYMCISILHTYRIFTTLNRMCVERSTIHRTVNELPTRKMHASQIIFLGYIEIVYISTHIGIESVSGDGLRLATRMRQARSLQAPL